MSANTYVIDALTRHQVYLQRYAAGEVKQLLPFIDDMLTQVQTRIISSNVTPFQLARLTQLERDLTTIISQSTNSMTTQMLTDFEQFGDYEAGFTQRLLDGMVNTETNGVTIDRVISSITNTPMNLVSGNSTVNVTIEQAARQFASSTSRSVIHSIQAGLAEGRTTSDIAREISRIVSGRTRSQAEALIRTSANHAGTISRNKLYEENADILSGEEFVATLDSHTTLVCGGNDGKQFDLGDGPMPALHFNCRSIRVPIVYPEFVIGDLEGVRPAVDEGGATTVSAKSTYSGWLRRQPASFQDTALGEQRAKLFRNGGLSIDKFTDDTGITYTLDELRALEPTAFERANL